MSNSQNEELCIQILESTNKEFINALSNFMPKNFTATEKENIYAPMILMGIKCYLLKLHSELFASITEMFFEDDIGKRYELCKYFGDNLREQLKEISSGFEQVDDIVNKL